MKVLFLTYGSGELASSRIRVYQYLPHLRERGIAFTVLPYYNRLASATRGDHPVSPERPPLSRMLGKVIRRIVEETGIATRLLRFLALSLTHDVIFIQKAILPAWARACLGGMRKRIIFDMDDPLFANPKLYNVRACEAMLSMASRVLLANSRNSEYVRKFNQNISIIIGPVDCDRYAPRTVEKAYRVIGWIGTAATEKYLEVIEGPLRKIRDEFHARLEFIGADRALGLGAVKRWSLESEAADMARFDIGVMPLTDDEWAKGKGGYKILQYMAMGIPSVASAVGINNDIIVDGTTGFLCRTREEWSDRLARLVNDASLRQRMARAARERALEHFSLKGARDGFIEILKGTP